MPQLPPALLTHIETDVVLLERLVQRSRDQHKSAIFYQSAKHVLRVGKKVVESLESYKAETAEGSRDASKREKRLGKLAMILAATLLNSARKNSQQIQILYFLPLTTLLQAIYGRLFTLTLSLGPVFGVDADRLYGVRKPSAIPAKSHDTSKLIEASAEDFGQRIERVNPMPGMPKAQDLITSRNSSSMSRSTSSEQVQTHKSSHLGPVVANVIDRAAAKPTKRPSEEPAGPPRTEKKIKINTPLEKISLDSIFGEETKKKKKKKGADGGEVSTAKKKKKKADEMEAIFG